MCKPNALLFLASIAVALVSVDRAIAADVAMAVVGKVDFSKEIRPILSDRCFQCHGPDEKNRRAAFRLDQEDSALGTAASGAHPIVRGKPETSELIRRITAQAGDERMPPSDSNKTLSTNEIELLRRWIKEGAQWKQHWAFVRPARPAEPSVKGEAAPRNSIDRFVLARLEAEGLKPSPAANREAIIRRVSFDMIGLPPTPKEIDDFLADKSEQAYERLVDRLLASPHYGEWMAVHWLDGARFADTNGYQNDFARDMSPWRDWVIAAYNNNMRYDEFVVEQIAGDLLPDATQSQKVATGFLRNNRSVTEAGSIEAEWKTENLIDRVETTSDVMLGLTMGCARCHDHKYDPITQRDFYRFLAFFNSTKDRGFYSETRGNTGPVVHVVQPSQQRRIDELDAAIAKAQQAIAAAKAKTEAQFAEWKKKIGDQSPQANPTAVLSLPLNGDLRYSQGKPLQPSDKVSLGVYESGSPNWGAGISGKALEFSGAANSHVSLGEAVQFNKDAKFSIACWVRPDAAGALWSKMDDGAAFRGFDTLVFDDGKMELHLIHHWPDKAIKVTTKQNLRMGQSNFLCITYDGSSKAKGITIYIDGQKVPLEINSNSLSETVATSQPFRLGCRSDSLFFKGALSDFAAYDRILSSEEIQALVTSTLATAVKQKSIDAAHERLLQNYFESHFSTSARLEESLAKLRAEKDDYLKTSTASVMVLEEMEKPQPTYLLKRGQYDAPDKTQVLEPGVPGFLPPLPKSTPQNRLGLARWLVDPANPLVARVEANRLWLQFFGQGLVATPDNLGFQGDPPTNPELLDWLATELMRLNWNVKALQREIVLSSTYRQSSAIPADLAKRDPENRLLARGPRHRLAAEAIRDNALAAAGLLSLKIGGPSVMPYQPAGLWEELAGGAGQGPYKQATGEDLHRRSLYTYRKRTVPHPTTSTFDAPTWEYCTAKRSRTNTPLQALALLNDETYVEVARSIAQRMMLEGGSDVEQRVRYGFRLTMGRQPAAKEIERLTSTYGRYYDAFHRDSASAHALLSVGEFRADAKLDPAKLAAYATVASILLNLDETITKQ